MIPNEYQCYFFTNYTASMSVW